MRIDDRIVSTLRNINLRERVVLVACPPVHAEASDPTGGQATSATRIPDLSFGIVQFAFILVALIGTAASAGDVEAERRELKAFRDGARPVLAAQCLKCHGPKEKKGGVDLSGFEDDRSILRSRKLWRRAIEQVEAEEMPPAGEPTLAPAHRDALLGGLRSAVEAGEGDGPRPGPSPIRRLSLFEYQNTVRDLLGVSIDAASAVGMPDERDGDGPGGLAAVLDVSPAQMEKYFAAADKILDRFFGTELTSNVDGTDVDRARLARERLFGVRPGSWRNPSAAVRPPAGVSERDAARRLIAGVLRRAYRRPPTEAEVGEMMRLYDRASARKAGYVGSVRPMLKAVLVSPKFLLRLERDRPDSEAGRAYRVDDHELAARLSYFLWSSMPDERLMDLADRGLLAKPGPSEDSGKLGGVPIGPPTPGDVRKHTPLEAFDGDLATFADGSGGLWVGLDLHAPRRITHVRTAPRPDLEDMLVGGKVQGSNDPEFRTDIVDLVAIDKRPEKGLFRRDVASEGSFRYVRYVVPEKKQAHLAELEVWGPSGGTILEAEVRRMLDDPRARALTEDFAAGWLQIRKLPSARPSTEFFPEFSQDVRKAMFEETSSFFDALRLEDRSLLELLDADWTYLNEDLARYYKIPGVSGRAMRRVSLKPGTGRGGLLGMGSVLAVTSHTSRTSPTMRGKWVLDVILGTPPPPPPANAGMFKDEDVKGKEPRSFRELMARHARDPSCASCHRKMDPLGYALENYDAAGRWRDNDRGRPLDNLAKLPTGESFRGVPGLKKILLSRRDQFERNLIERLLTYALARDPDPDDDRAIDAVQSRLAREGHRFSALILGIVESDPFLYRINREPDEGEKSTKPN